MNQHIIFVKNGFNVAATSIFVAVLLLFQSCGGPTEETEEKTEATETEQEATEAKLSEEESIIKKGDSISQTVFRALSGELQQKIRETSIGEAISYCSERAIPLTDSIAREYNAEIKRVATRYRNPVNKASPEEEEILEQFEDNLRQDEEIKPVVSEFEEYWQYNSPIVMRQSLCLNCHGKPEEDIASEDYIAIQLIYPEDKATGFSKGDLRGMWQIKLEKPEI